MKLKTLLRELGEEYGDGWPVSREEAFEGLNGDGLASFIYLELSEVLETRKVDLGTALTLLERAVDDLHRVIYKIQELDGNYPTR